MNLFQTIGLAWIVFSSGLATYTVFYLAWVGYKRLSEEQRRGAEEDLLDIQRARCVRYDIERGDLAVRR
jgi:hypothetical protein